MLQNKLKSHNITIKSIEQQNQLYKNQLDIVNKIQGNVNSAEQLFYET